MKPSSSDLFLCLSALALSCAQPERERALYNDATAPARIGGRESTFSSADPKWRR